MRPKISIIVPCYGVEKYFDRCMESLVNQSLRDIEIILVDDVSPDRVPEMCDEWAKKDGRIKVIHKEKNGGLGFARNTGLDEATGEFIAFVDSDDYVETNAYEIYYKYAIEHGAQAVSAGMYNERNHGKWVKQSPVNTVTTLDKEQSWTYAKDMVASLPKEKVERKSRMSVWHILYKHSIIKENNIRFMSEREVNSEDLPFQLDYFRHVDKTILIPDCLYYYCQNSTSLTSTFRVEKFDRYIKMRQILLQKMQGDQEAYLRADRYFIGYARSYSLNLLRSTRNDKNDVLRTMLNNSIWLELRSQYKPHYLPPYQAILYWLQVHKWQKVIFPYLKFANLFKNK